MLAEFEFQNVDSFLVGYQLTLSLLFPGLSFFIPTPNPLGIIHPSLPGCLEPHILPTLFTILVLGAGCPGLAMRPMCRSERIPLPHPQPQPLEEKGLAVGGVLG